MGHDDRYLIQGMRVEIRNLERELWIRSEAIRRLSGTSCREATKPERARIQREGLPASFYLPDDLNFLKSGPVLQDNVPKGIEDEAPEAPEAS